MEQDSVTINIMRLRPEQDADIPLPCYMTPYSSGMDIYAAVEKEILLEPGEIRLIPTGFAIAIPHGAEAQIRPGAVWQLNTALGLSILPVP